VYGAEAQAERARRERRQNSLGGGRSPLADAQSAHRRPASSFHVEQASTTGTERECSTL